MPLLATTDYAQGELGDVVFVEIETIGKSLEKNRFLAPSEAVKTVLDMFMPVAGTVLEKNPLLDPQPESNKQRPIRHWLDDKN